jgi:plasmid stability protein
MNIMIDFLTYDGMHGHAVLSDVSDFLLLNAPQSFGPTIEKIEIYAHLDNRRIPRSVSPDRRKYFRERLAKLPLLVFQPKNRRFELSYFSQLGMAEDLAREDSQRSSIPLFRRACHEVVSALSLIRERLKPDDKFDFEAFNSFLQRRLQHMPNNLSELKKALIRSRAKQHRRSVAEHRATVRRLLRSPKSYKIFTCLDFHTREQRELPARLARAFRLRINHIVDSFSMRIPKKIKTQFFHKLNVIAWEATDFDKCFWYLDGIGHAELLVPDLGSIFRVSQGTAVKRVKAILRRGLEFAGKNDLLFARHMSLWRRLLATTDQEFDFDLRLSRTHRSRRWTCQAVMRITPAHYHYDIVVKDSRTSHEVERHRIKSTECLFPFYHGIGFAKLRWDNQDILVLARNGAVVRRFKTKLPT